MEIKSFEEIKSILKKFKHAGGVGFTIAHELFKIASQVGLLGYADALNRWFSRSISSATTDETEIAKMSNGLSINWEGASLRIDSKNNIIVGLKRTIEDIELVVK